MLPPSCARCGTPIIAGPAEAGFQDLCGSCAARATEEALGATLAERSSAGTTWSLNPAPAATTDRPQFVVKTRPLDGLLIGTAAAGIAGAAWWAAATRVSWDYWSYLAILVGAVIGAAVVVGSRKGGIVPGIIALVIGAACVVVTVYFITRSIDIRDAPHPNVIPLWTNWGHAKDLVVDAAKADKIKAAGWLGAPVVGALLAGWPRSRPLIG